MTTKENGPVNSQPKARAPSRGGWAKDERADISAKSQDGENDAGPQRETCGEGKPQIGIAQHLGSIQDPVAELAQHQFEPLALYLHRAISELVECHRQSAQAFPSCLDSGLSSHSLTPRRKSPISEDGAAGQNESPEAVGGADHGPK